MTQTRVLALGASRGVIGKTDGGIDQSILEAHGSYFVTLLTGKAVNADSTTQLIETAPQMFEEKLKNIETNDAPFPQVIKIGTLFSVAQVKALVSIPAFKTATVILDIEILLKEVSVETKNTILSAIREDILPHVTLLLGTVPDLKAIFENADIDILYPQNMADVTAFARTAQSLGPKNVLVKREIFDDEAGLTTLHFLLVVEEREEPVSIGKRFQSSGGVKGSAGIAATIAANLAEGKGIERAVGAAFTFIGDALKDGKYFT
ncbi:pyridoxamine kinase [Bisporella sp. PMI_857]|nr:pyridoxamine kinase [Bisporella sp. PMI_857]